MENKRLQEYYHERAGIMEFDGGEIHNQASLQAWNDVFKLFMQDECPNDDEIVEFKRGMSKKDR